MGCGDGPGVAWEGRAGGLAAPAVSTPSEPPQAGDRLDVGGVNPGPSQAGDPWANVTLTDSEQLWLEAEVDAAMRFANTELLTGYLFDPRFAFSFDKGLLLLGKSTMAKLNVTVVHVNIAGWVSRA